MVATASHWPIRYPLVMQRSRHVLAVIAIEVLAITCLAASSQADKDKDKKNKNKDKDNFVSKEDRQAAIRRAKVDPDCDPVDGSPHGTFRPGIVYAGRGVACDYVEKKMNGNSPKLTCRLADKDEVKVKSGATTARCTRRLRPRGCCGRLASAPTTCIRSASSATGVRRIFTARLAARKHGRVGRASEHRAQDARACDRNA